MTDLAAGQVPTGVGGETVPFDAAWAAVRDALLRGLTHALSNRVMAIATLADLTSDARAGEVLAGESRRLDTLLRQFRMLCSTDPSLGEPVHLADLMPPLVALAARHPDVADLACKLEVAPDVEPVWGDPVSIQRVILTLIVAAARAARQLGIGVVWLGWGAADGVAIVRLGASPAGAARGPTAPSAAAAPAPGAYTIRVIEPAAPGTGVWYELVLPTRADARRRGA